MVGTSSRISLSGEFLIKVLCLYEFIAEVESIQQISQISRISAPLEYCSEIVNFAICQGVVAVKIQPTCYECVFLLLQWDTERSCHIR